MVNKMYPYDFEPKKKSLNMQEIFVAMPFHKDYDKIYNQLIEPAVEKANEKLDYLDDNRLYPYRTKDDPKTVSGWINILEHLFSAHIVLGVLTSNNPNVFYELGIAHATQPISRQILIANKGYRPKFDLKDLIFLDYHEDFELSIDLLATKIQSAIEYYDIETDKRIHKARMRIGPFGFSVMLKYLNKSHFNLEISKEFASAIADIPKGIYDKHLQGVESLCQEGLLGLYAIGVGAENKIKYSFYWTGLGNEVLLLLKLINEKEFSDRLESLPPYFR